MFRLYRRFTIKVCSSAFLPWSGRRSAEPYDSWSGFLNFYCTPTPSSA